MKLKVLVDNNTFIDEYYFGEPAVSYYIEDEGTKILFDTGYSDIFIKNAKVMNVDLKNIDSIVISHGHNDHTGGLKYLCNYLNNGNIELISHPDCFQKKYYKNIYIGSPVSCNELEKKIKLKLYTEPVKISKNITFLGEIPNISNYEKREIIGYYENSDSKQNDYVKDDSAIVYKGEKGLFIITGCSHSGICNILEYAKTVCNEKNIYGVIGGFHLLSVDDKLKNTINYLKENILEEIYPCHCVSLDAKVEMGKYLDIKEVGVGLELTIN